MITELQQLVMSGSYPVWLVMLSIVLLSYLLEDVAIVSAASVAAQGVLPPSLALVAIMFGIITGDAGLYFIGVFARKSRYLRYRVYTNRYFHYIRNRFQKGVFVNLFIARFIPGLRTAGFTLSGFLAIPFSLFLLAVMVSTTLWVALVFTLVYRLGSSAWVQAAQYQWLLIVFAAALLFAANRFVRHSISRRLL